MTRFDSRRGASNLGVPLMIVSFVLMGGLMYWLSITAEPTEIVVVEEEPVEVFLGSLIDGTILEAPDIVGYEGLEVRVIDLPFAQEVGTAQFFVSLPKGSPFLIRMGDELRADSMMTMPSGVLTITGMLYPLTDSIRDVWEAEGTVDGASRPLVDFAAHFIDATDIMPGAPPAAPAAPEGGEGGEGA